MKTKQRMRLEIKEISAEGYFEGLLSPFGVVDGGGDVVESTAFTKSLNDHGNKVPLLWQHKSDVPIGDLTLEERPEGLWCKGQLLMTLAEAQKAYLLIKARIVKGLSIGFVSLRDSIANGVRHLKEVRLYEGSIVTFPMAETALITSVKAAGGSEAKGDFLEELNEIQLGDAGYQMRNALAYALSSVVWSDLTREEKISATETVIQQFSDAYMAYIPLYLDMLTEMYGGMETWNQKRFETKAGATFSAATKAAITAACDKIHSGHEELRALIADDAGTSTSSEKAAAPKSEPDPLHSAATQTLIESIRSLIPAA